MQLKVKVLKFFAGRPVAIINVRTANKINVHIDERLNISKNGKSMIAIVDTAVGLVRHDELLVSNEVVEILKLKKGDKVEVSLAKQPESILFIRKKLDSEKLKENEIYSIIKDIVKNALSEVEIAYFVSAVYKCGMTHKEIEYLIKAMVNAGNRIHFKGKVVDKHSIGGIAGNRTTPIVVSICAAAGLIMPKTSSRAITSVTGTADVIESIARVEFDIKELKHIVERTNACMVWGDFLGLSPADDKIIQIERLLHLDPEPQLLSSVLSKKISVGSKYVLIDIPFGKSAKVNKSRALKLKRDFEYLAPKLKMKIKCVLTKGDEPIGNGMGPLLEIRDILAVLQLKENRPIDLENKSIYLAGQLFELCGHSKNGQGEKLARQILYSGKAFKKFEEIIIAQGGKIPKNFKFGKIQKTIRAKKDFIIKNIDNKKINIIGNLTGSPMDDGAGLYLYKHVGDKVKKGDSVLTLYSESNTRMKEALDFYIESKPITD